MVMMVSQDKRDNPEIRDCLEIEEMMEHLDDLERLEVERIIYNQKKCL